MKNYSDSIADLGRSILQDSVNSQEFIDLFSFTYDFVTFADLFVSISVYSTNIWPEKNKNISKSNIISIWKCYIDFHLKYKINYNKIFRFI